MPTQLLWMCFKKENTVCYIVSHKVELKSLCYFIYYRKYHFPKYSFVTLILKLTHLSWPVWVSWLELHPVIRESHVWFPVRANAWVVGLVPDWDAFERQPIDVSLSHWSFSSSLSPFLPLSLKSVIMSSGEDKKVNTNAVMSSCLMKLSVYFSGKV